MQAWTEPMRQALRWPERLAVSAWADRFRVLDQQTSADPGPWKTARVPYAREWMDSATLPWVRQVTMQKSTQVAGTETLLNVLGFAIDQDPGPITYVMPSREEAEHFGENRVMPMIRACPALKAQLTGKRFDAKRRRIKFRRCTLHLRTSRVPAELAQLAARWLFCDEANKWPTWTQKEAGPLDLAIERTRTFWNHVIYVCSTPTMAGGLISREFEKGDRRRFHVPCPACGKFQVLRWAQVKWPEDVETEEQMRRARAAWYECEHCKHKLTDHQKVEILARGTWIPEAVDWREHVKDGVLQLPHERAQHRSYHIWAGYSPWVTWWEIAAKWLAAKDDPPQLQNFINSWLGEPWEEKVQDPKTETIRACAGTYKRGTVPPGVLVITAGADVQKAFIPFVVRGWGLDRESWLLDHGRAETLEQLGDLLFRRDWSGGLDARRHLVVRLLFIDYRYRPEDVWDFARRFGAFVRLSIGVEREDPRPFAVKTLERHPVTGAPLPNSTQVWHVNTGQFKDQVSVAIERRGEPGPRAFHVYPDVDETYVAEMTAEHKVLVRKGDRAKERWIRKPGRKANHYWDAEALAFAAAELLGIDKMREHIERAQTRARPQTSPPGRDEPDGGPRLWRRTT
jgi:phage terminase large subunit GpA-like protein